MFSSLDQVDVVPLLVMKPGTSAGSLISPISGSGDEIKAEEMLYFLVFATSRHAE